MPKRNDMEERKIKYSTERDQDIRAFMRELLEEVLSEKKETLRTWFSRRGAPGGKGGWVDCNSPIRKDGKITGYKPCGRQKGEKTSKISILQTYPRRM
jgi:hypothetical protein